MPPLPRRGSRRDFVDAPESVEELAAVAAAVRGPLVANMSESGKTPILPLTELGSLGYRIVLHPTSALRLSVGMITAVYADLRAHGSTGRWVEQMTTLDDLDELLGLGALRALEQDAQRGPGDAARG